MPSHRFPARCEGILMMKFTRQPYIEMRENLWCVVYPTTAGEIVFGHPRISEAARDLARHHRRRAKLLAKLNMVEEPKPFSPEPRG